MTRAISQARHQHLVEKYAGTCVHMTMYGFGIRWWFNVYYCFPIISSDRIVLYLNDG